MGNLHLLMGKSSNSKGNFYRYAKWSKDKFYSSNRQGPCLRDDGLLAFRWLRAKTSQAGQNTSNVPPQAKSNWAPNQSQIELHQFVALPAKDRPWNKHQRSKVSYVHLLRKLSESGRPGSIVLSCHELSDHFQKAWAKECKKSEIAPATQIWTPLTTNSECHIHCGL